MYYCSFSKLFYTGTGRDWDTDQIDTDWVSYSTTEIDTVCIAPWASYSTLGLVEAGTLHCNGQVDAVCTHWVG